MDVTKRREEAAKILLLRYVFLIVLSKKSCEDGCDLHSILLEKFSPNIFFGCHPLVIQSIQQMVKDTWGIKIMS